MEGCIDFITLPRKSLLEQFFIKMHKLIALLLLHYCFTMLRKEPDDRKKGINLPLEEVLDGTSGHNILE
jgi:hypothetical protein